MCITSGIFNQYEQSEHTIDITGASTRDGDD